MSMPEPLALAAIAAMAITVFAMRAGGFWLMGRVPLTARVRRMLEALPGSIVAAIVLPLVERIGPTALLAVAVAALVMVVRRNEMLAVAAGMAVVIAFRW